MQENKYFYNGIPLTDYCRDNGINDRTARTRIWKMRQKEKYAHLTDQEIVDYVISSYGCSKPYQYKGISLRQYCKENDVPYATMIYRINVLRNRTDGLTDDELVIMAVENFENLNYTLFYHGMSLKDFCEQNPEIDYSAAKNHVVAERKKHPELLDEEILDRYIHRQYRGIYKYYYCGIPLKQYCKENNIVYQTVRSYIYKFKKDERYASLSDDELVAIAVDKYKPFEPKYMYHGMSLRSYCQQNDVSYYSVVSFVKRKLAIDASLSIDDLIDEGVRTIKKRGVIYYYHGIPLVDYARENGLNEGSIRVAILRKGLNGDKPLQEIVDECVESYREFSIKYYYDGVPLARYCESVGLNYSSVISRYFSNYAGKTDLSTDEAIKEIVEYFLNNPPVLTKYFFGEFSLYQFCSIKGYPYRAIWQRIKTLESKAYSLSNQEIVDLAIEKYENKQEILRINYIFNRLKQMEYFDECEIVNICDDLKIDYTSVVDLVNMGLSYNYAINMIWYFSDDRTVEGYMTISDGKIKEIFSLVDTLRNQSTSIEEFELYDLIGIYKSGLYDSRNEILIRMQKYIYEIIYSISKEYHVYVDKDREEFESELKYYILALINKTSVNNIGQILNYIDLSIKGQFRKYLKNYIRQNSALSLDEPFGSSDGKKQKTRLEYLSDSQDQFESLNCESFSSDMMKALSSLSQDELTFVILKYQECYSDDDLSRYFGLPIEEVYELDNKIIETLRCQESMQAFMSKKN